MLFDTAFWWEGFRCLTPAWLEFRCGRVGVLGFPRVLQGCAVDLLEGWLRECCQPICPAFPLTPRLSLGTSDYCTSQPGLEVEEPWHIGWDALHFSQLLGHSPGTGSSLDVMILSGVCFLGRKEDVDKGKKGSAWFGIDRSLVYAVGSV